MDELIKEMLSKIRYYEDDFLLLDTNSSGKFKIIKDNFIKIEKKKSFRKLAFIDGGNMEIFKSPSLSVFFNRIYYVIYDSKRKAKNRIFEFYSLFNSVKKKDCIIYSSEYFFLRDALDLKKYEFDSFDKTISVSGTRAQISALGDVIRRFSEIKATCGIDRDCVVVLDGTFEAKYTYEPELLQELKESKNILCAISKTTSLLTENGNSLAGHLNNMAESESWVYYAGKINDKLHSSDLYFMKFHKSEYIFRLEIDNLNGADLMEIISLISENCTDPVFPGYPYGLMQADMFARVSKKEAKDLQLKMLIKLGKDFEKVKPLIRSMDAHSVLDSMG